MYFANGWDYWELRDKVTFDGALKQISVNPGETVLDIRANVYSAWVRWSATRDNSKYLQAMRYTGLDIIPGGFTGDTYFLINGWKLIVDLTTAKISGVLFSEDYTTAYYDANLNAQYPATVAALVNSVTSYSNVVTGDLSSIVVPSAAQNATAVQNALAADFAAVPSDVWAKAVEGLTAEEMLRVMLAALSGKRQGLGTATEQYLSRDGTKPRITLTPDAAGNGTPTVDATP